jgi:hypothetical protein
MIPPQFAQHRAGPGFSMRPGIRNPPGSRRGGGPGRLPVCFSYQAEIYLFVS